MNVRLSLYFAAAAVFLICFGFILGFYVGVLPAQPSPTEENVTGANPMMPISLDKFTIVIES